MDVIPVVLCGGAGTRLWPLSRELYPKQLLALVDEYSLLQNTITRCSGHAEVTDPVLVCNEEHRFLVAEQLRQIDVKPRQIILEPQGRNTAPATALAALEAIKSTGDAILVVLPSDHVIKSQDVFINALSRAIELANDDKLVTFGVVPDRAETGYGYIRSEGLSNGVGSVAEFVEKPDQPTAERYLASGDYYWNSGMFVFKASAFMNELRANREDIASAIEQTVAGSRSDLDFTRVDEEAFRACPSDSIDYAVMEKTTAAMVVALDAGWSDIGSWDALWGISEKDGANNTLVGDVAVSDVSNSYVRAEHRLVSVVGLEDVVVVETADAVMVASQDRAQDVKSIVNNLKQGERTEHVTHRKVYRPWGYYESIDSGPTFQVKRINVSPGSSLSLQMHHRRSEHWVVVSGIATVTIDDDVFELKPNESCYIPLEARHRLQNLTSEPVELIEVQSGDYLGEDDIVRFEDNYGR